MEAPPSPHSQSDWGEDSSLHVDEDSVDSESDSNPDDTETGQSESESAAESSDSSDHQAFGSNFSSPFALRVDDPSFDVPFHHCKSAPILTFSPGGSLTPPTPSSQTVTTPGASEGRGLSDAHPTTPSGPSTTSLQLSERVHAVLEARQAARGDRQGGYGDSVHSSRSQSPVPTGTGTASANGSRLLTTRLESSQQGVASYLLVHRAAQAAGLHVPHHDGMSISVPCLPSASPPRPTLPPGARRGDGVGTTLSFISSAPTSTPNTPPGLLASCTRGLPSSSPPSLAGSEGEEGPAGADDADAAQSGRKPHRAQASWWTFGFAAASIDAQQQQQQQQQYLADASAGDMSDGSCSGRSSGIENPHCSSRQSGAHSDAWAKSSECSGSGGTQDSGPASKGGAATTAGHPYSAKATTSRTTMTTTTTTTTTSTTTSSSDNTFFWVQQHGFTAQNPDALYGVQPPLTAFSTPPSPSADSSDTSSSSSCTSVEEASFARLFPTPKGRSPRGPALTASAGAAEDKLVTPRGAKESGGARLRSYRRTVWWRVWSFLCKAFGKAVAFSQSSLGSALYGFFCGYMLSNFLLRRLHYKRRLYYKRRLSLLRRKEREMKQLARLFEQLCRLPALVLL